MIFMVLPLGTDYVHCSHNGHSSKHRSMLAHQTMNTSVQIVAISSIDSSMASAKFDFWAKFAADRSISWKASNRLAQAGGCEQDERGKSTSNSWLSLSIHVSMMLLI
jgi:hypothetical protein